MNNTFGNYIKRKRTEMGLSLRKFGELCGISHTHIDSIEKGVDFRTGKAIAVSNETTEKIAKALDIDSDILYLLKINSNSPKFDFYYDPYEDDNIRGQCDIVLKDKNKSIEEKFEAAELMLKTYYSRSITAAKFDKNHVGFKEYASLLLDQDQWKDRFGDTVYNLLVKKYGCKEGLEGSTYYSPKNKKAEDLPNYIELDKKLHRIPILGCIAAGLPIYADQNIEGYTYTDLNGGAEYFGLRVKGDSMDSLRICDGDVIIVRRQSAVENGDIAVVLVDDENATVKQFFQDGTKVTLVPRSNNPEHLPQFYDLKKTSINVLGKVVRNQINF